MNIKENIRIAIFSIRTNMMRSLLTMLGIIIGVASVIAIVTLGNGGRDYIVGMIEDMGSNAVNISVNAKNASSSDYITIDDVSAIKALDSVEYISPIVITMGSASATQDSGIALIVSGNIDLQQVMGISTKHGRFFNEEEYNSASRVAVISELSAHAMFGYSNPVGEYVDVSVNDQTVSLKIIGVMSGEMAGSMEDYSESMAMFDTGAGATCMLIAPSTLTDQMLGNSGRYDMCYLTASSDDMLDAAGTSALNLLYARHGNHDSEVYTVVNMATYIDLLDTVIRVFTTFIAAVSAISLLVGGIGVMNIMLVSVTERTREIGIRKALGAKTSVILFQFLTESIILCLIGGLIGLVIGTFGAFTVAEYMNIPIRLQFSTVAIAVGFSSAIGIFFGIYPARRAAKMHPIDALRRE